MLHRLTTQVGQTESDHGRICPNVITYFKAAGVSIPETAACPYWGGALMAWAAIQDGIVPPVGSVDAIAWLGWGSPLASPVPGAVLVLTSGAGASRMEIGIATRVHAGAVYAIGANDGVVSVKRFPLEQVIAARRPPGASMPTVAQVAEAMPPLALASPAQPAPAALPQPAVIEHQPHVTPEALERLLALVQEKFTAQDAEIAAIRQSALGSITIREEVSQ